MVKLASGLDTHLELAYASTVRPYRPSLVGLERVWI